MDTDRVISAVRAAFAGVQLGNGIGLWESQAIDDYETEENQKVARGKDIYDSWQSLKREDLHYAYSSLSFVDEEGIAFLLPAYITHELEGAEFPCDVALYACILHGYHKFKFFTEEQKRAIQLYLEWALEDDDNEYIKLDIEKALKEFWKLPAEKLPIGLTFPKTRRF